MGVTWGRGSQIEQIERGGRLDPVANFTDPTLTVTTTALSGTSEAP
jgi:hypothetical protein